MMRIRGYIFLPLTFALIAFVSNVKTAPRTCSPTRHCTCNVGIVGDLEIVCPPPPNPQKLQINAQAGKYVHIQCSEGVTVADYDLLPRLNFEEVDFFRLLTCPFSEELTFKYIIDKIGVKNIKAFLFQNNVESSSPPVSFKKKHFKGMPNITRLLMSTNDFVDIPVDLLEYVPEITWLDLRSNNVHLPSGFFDYTPLLDILELGHNGITHLEPGIFANLTKLTRLNLWKNSLRNLQSDIFADLTNLKILDLHANGLEEIPADLFGHLTNLNELNIYSNNFKSFPEGNIFENNTKLEIFSFYDNRTPLITLPNGLLANLTYLRDVRLQQNHMKEIPEDIFWGSTNIANISLYANSLTSLPDQLFSNLTNLYSLDISHNLLTTLPADLFHSLSGLRVLKLDHNLLTAINSDTFLGLYSLEEINLDNNLIETIHEDAFKVCQNMTIFRLNNNRLHFKESVNRDTSPFGHSKHIRELYLSNNSIDFILSDWRVSINTLQTLDLRWNKIKYIEFSRSLHFLSPGVKVDLRYNDISKVDFEYADKLVPYMGPKYDAFSGPSKNTIVKIENNPIDCSCVFYFFSQYLQGLLNPKVRAIVELDVGNLTCASPPEYYGRHVKSFRSEEISCPLNITSEKDTCPHGCECRTFNFDRSLHVNCANLNLTEMPSSPIRDKKFVNLFLHFEYNHLTALSENWIENQTVTFLNVSKNSISNVEYLPPNLKILDLSNNNLTFIDPNALEQMSHMTNLTSIQLHGNPWKCDCDARNLLKFIQSEFKKITDLNSIQCEENNKILSTLQPYNLCPTHNHVIIGVCVAVALFAILIGTMVALYYRFRQEIKVWLFAHKMFLWFVSEKELDKDKVYDAFVSYSHKDEDFIINELVPHLEQGDTPFKLCLHFRDWIAGEFIPNQIARSIEDSRRTLIVLSPHFVDSVWSKMEFRSAHLTSMKEGRARVIVIKYGDITDEDKLDAELKAYLAMNTYIEWGDKQFWDRLRYALPHPPQLSKRGAFISRKIKESLDDKLELIRPISTPPAVQTPPAESADSNPLMDKMNLILNERNGIINNGLSLSNGSLKNPAENLTDENNKINGVLNASIISNGSILNGKLVNSRSKQSDV